MMTEKFSTEIMDMEQLDEVSGGGYIVTSRDSKFLNDLGGTDLCDRYGKFKTFFDSDIDNEVARAWQKCGIDVCIRQYADNVYIYKGEQINRVKAMLIACEKYGKKLINMNIDEYGINQ
ncbi:MAG: hypothetical protein IKZ58_01120 [Selenomonadaceae bacterium]|nr:hypothetical protein [Selenomonadaceae bacterium]